MPITKQQHVTVERPSEKLINRSTTTLGLACKIQKSITMKRPSNYACRDNLTTADTKPTMLTTGTASTRPSKQLDAFFEAHSPRQHEEFASNRPARRRLSIGLAGYNNSGRDKSYTRIRKGRNAQATITSQPRPANQLNKG